MQYFKELYESDKNRYGSKFIYEKMFSYFLRKCQTSKSFLNKFYKIIFLIISRFHGIEVSTNLDCGKGFQLRHPYNITINANASIGDYCTICRGGCVGEEARGKRKGAPKIGNFVYIGINAVIVGNVIIGDDVLIAPNSFVNCDIPSNSVVIGNPCKIIRKENATQGYL